MDCGSGSCFMSRHAAPKCAENTLGPISHHARALHKHKVRATHQPQYRRVKKQLKSEIGVEAAAEVNRFTEPQHGGDQQVVEQVDGVTHPAHGGDRLIPEDAIEKDALESRDIDR